MPSGASGVAQFVGSKALENNADAVYLSANELARRKALAKNAKIQPKSSLTHTVRSQPILDRRTAPPARQYDQPAGHLETGREDPFEASDLEDSDNTTRDLDPQTSRGRQARSSFSIRQDSEGGHEVEQDLERQSNHEVENYVYNNDYRGGVPNYRIEDGLQPNSLPYLNGNAILDAESMEAINQQISRCRESEQYKNGEKLHSIRFGSSHLPSMMPSHFGRSTPAHAPVPGFYREEEEMDYVNETRHETGEQWNDQSRVIVGSVDGNMTDGNTTAEYLIRDNHGQLNDAKYATRNRASTEHGSNGSQSSGESSPSSPSQHTPRANESSKKPATTSSKPEKRMRDSLELDYDETVLGNMKYSELKDQPFNANPRLPDDGIPAFLKDPKTSLKDLLENLKSSHQDDQMAFFLQMPLDQWEQAGDWFLECFSDLILKIREARRSKRDVSKIFEQELADREESVRGQTKSIQEVFKKMKEGGEGVLKENLA